MSQGQMNCIFLYEPMFEPIFFNPELESSVNLHLDMTLNQSHYIKVKCKGQLVDFFN